MARIPRFGLSVRMNLLSISLILLTAIGIAGWFLLAESRDIEQRLAEEGRNLAAMMAQNSEFGIYAEDRATLGAIMRGVDAYPAVAYAAFRDRNGKVLLSHSRRSGPALPDRTTPAGKAGPSPEFRSVEFRGSDGRRYVDVLAPVTSPEGGEMSGVFLSRGTGARVIGYAQVGLDREIAGARLRSHIRSAILATSILVLLGIGATLLMTRRISVPIGRLVDFSRTVSGEHLDRRIAIRGPAEIEELARAFNEMLEGLQASRDQVERQTGELTEANRKMEIEIAERREAQEARALLEAAVEQTAEAILVTDPDGTIEYVNPAFERISGYRKEDVLGQGIRMLENGVPGDAFMESAWISLRRGEVWSGVFANRDKDGAVFDVEAIFSPVRDGAGRIVNFVAVERDITQLRLMEEKLRQSQKMEAVGKLAGGIAHDFNNLLTAITGYSELLLLRIGEQDPLRKDVEEIRRAGTRAADLTRQLLAFSRKQMLAPRVIDLNAVVANLEAMLRRLIGETIELDWNPAPAPWPVRVDPGQMEQVILNLALNARDAMPDGGRLAVSTANLSIDGASPAAGGADLPPGDYLRLSVSDTGCGIDSRTLPRIFEPFFTTKETGKGTGLGLSTVYGIVAQSNGHIRVCSEPGRGTTFDVFLPRVAGEAESAPLPGQVGTLGQWRGTETILIAEDEPHVREFLTDLLGGNGYRILLAKDGVEALRLIEERREAIPLLMTDVVMPRMGGPELARHVRERFPKTRIIFMSGYTESAVTLPDGLAGEARFLQKPFRPDAMLRAVRETLDA